MDGAIVRPGQTVMVKVVANPGKYTVVGVLGEVGRGMVNSPVGDPPWTIPVVIPYDTAPGITDIAAIAVIAPNVMVTSEPINLDVEPDPLPKISFDPPTISLQVGQCLRLTDDSQCGYTFETWVPMTTERR